jgi:putative ABC transport system permease protein
MWRASLRDLQWRRRRFLIGIAATALVLAMTLLMTGVSDGLHSQDRRIIESFDADAWLVAANGSGPFTSTKPIATSTLEQIEGLPGVTKASPVILAGGTIVGDERKDVNVIGLPPGGLGEPEVTDGRPVQADGEVVVDTNLGIDVGEQVNVNSQDMTVVGRADDVTYFFGTPTVFMTLADAQAQLFGDQPLAMAVAVQGDPDGASAELTSMTNDEARADLARPTASGDQTIQLINVLLWIVAAGIIGSIVYLSALERTRDFAVMKATGVANRSLLAGLVLQAIVLSLGAALFAVVLERLIAPGFPFEVEVTPLAYGALLGVAVLIGLVASIAGLRRAVRIDPALAFGGA